MILGPMGNFISLSSRRYSVWCVIVFCLLMLPLSALNGAQFFNDWAATNLVSVPSQNGPLDDPDNDGTANLAEFTFGTDPLAGSGFGNSILPVPTGTDGVFQVSLFEQGGHKPGVQIDVDATVDLVHWIRPWWLRTTNSLPGDPTNSVRETFITYLPGANLFIVRAAVHLIEAGPEAANYYVATNGNDTTGNGSINQPYRSLAKAVSVSSAGNLIYMRGGTYTTNATVTISTGHNGSAANPIRLRAYPGEHPILDFSSQADTDSNRGIQLQASWWRVYGLEIVGAGDNGMFISGSSNIVELCVFHDNRDTGLQIGSSGSSNLVLNCDSYHNNDSTSENADGFAPKLDSGPNNVLRGCRSWENADDGYDLYQAPYTVLIENCWAFRNGHYGTNGDRNGFKLGGSGVGAAHHLVNCVAFANPHHGFDQNNNTAAQTLDQCTAWTNGPAGGGYNFNLNHGPAVAHVLRNNLSIDGRVSTNTISILISNSWQVVTSPAASTNDLLSVDTAFAVAPRRDDGGLPETPFMRPVPGGRLVDKGADLGQPFYGSAPDLGAFETPVW